MPFVNHAMILLQDPFGMRRDEKICMG